MVVLIKSTLQCCQFFNVRQVSNLKYSGLKGLFLNIYIDIF